MFIHLHSLIYDLCCYKSSSGCVSPKAQMTTAEFTCTLPCAAAVSLLSSSLFCHNNSQEDDFSFKKQLHFSSQWKDPNRCSAGIFSPPECNSSLNLTALPCTYRIPTCRYLQSVDAFSLKFCIRNSK